MTLPLGAPADLALAAAVGPVDVQAKLARIDRLAGLREALAALAEDELADAEKAIRSLAAMLTRTSPDP